MTNNSNRGRYASVMAAGLVLTAACGAGQGGTDAARAQGGQPSPTAATATSAAATTSAPDRGGYLGSSNQSNANSAATRVDTLMVATSTGLGQILVDGHGGTLYLFLKDTTRQSRCADRCAQVWPPAIGDTHTAVAAGARPSLVGSTSRPDGTTQLTYNSHPLYFYIGDKSGPGKTVGEGLNQFGAEWYALTPAGSKSERDGS
jgi:predicted lipoprotein with Yx(FWY)xxD motif